MTVLAFFKNPLASSRAGQRGAALTWVARAVGDQQSEKLALDTIQANLAKDKKKLETVLRRFEQKRARIEGYANRIANQAVLELLQFLELGGQLHWLVFRRSGLHDTSCVPTSDPAV